MEKLLLLVRILKDYPRYGIQAVLWVVVGLALAAIHVNWCEMGKAIRLLITKGPL